MMMMMMMKIRMYKMRAEIEKFGDFQKFEHLWNCAIRVNGELWGEKERLMHDVRFF